MGRPAPSPWIVKWMLDSVIITRPPSLYFDHKIVCHGQPFQMITVLKKRGMLTSDLAHLLQWACWIENEKFMRMTNEGLKEDLNYLLRPLLNAGTCSTWVMSYEEVRNLPSPPIDTDIDTDSRPFINSFISSQIDEFVATFDTDPILHLL